MHATKAPLGVGGLLPDILRVERRAEKMLGGVLSAPRPRGWYLFVGCALLAALVLLIRPVRVAAQTLLVLPAVIQSAPIDPLGLLVARPTRTEHAFDYSAGTVAADIYHPGPGGRHGGVVLQLGARLVRRDPVLVRFAEGLARSGVVVLVPESTNLLAGRLVGEERDAIRRSYDLLLSQPDVDAARTGLVGFSVGGALCMVAAAQPELRDRVPFVFSFGGYYDAAQFMVDVGSRSIEVDGQVKPWEPSALTLEVTAQQLIEALPNAQDQSLLSRAFLSRETVEDSEWALLSPAGQDVRDLLAGTTRQRARTLVAGLPASGRERLAAISPSAYLSDMRTRLYLMHDTGDTYIPFTHTRELAANAPPRIVQRYTEFSIFQHVYPDRPVPWRTFLPELWALYWFAHAVLLELL